MFLAHRKSDIRIQLQDKLADIIARAPTTVAATLDRIAEAFNDLEGVEGAAIVAFGHDQRPLAVGRSQVALELDEKDLANLPATLRTGEDLCQIRTRPEADRALQAIAARTGGQLVGAALLVPRHQKLDEALINAARATSPWVANIVQTATYAESAERAQRLQALARRELGADDPDIGCIVRTLSELFHAAACTILLREEATETLRLSASTDPGLGEGEQVEYKPGEGLTGWVFQQGKPLRLANTDADRVKEVTGMERGQARFPECDAKGEPTTQFLGIPVRAGGRTLGVVRMSRLAHVARFTAEDESALQFFADLLGIALRRTWELLVSRTIADSTSIALALTRREPQLDGTFLPRLISVNPGALEMLGYTWEEIEKSDARELYAPGAYEDLREILEPELHEAIEHGRGELGPIDSELLHKDGSIRSIKISYRILADRRIQPAEVYTIGIFRDRTTAARDQAQHRRLMEMLEGMGLAYFLSDFSGRVLETSKAEAVILGYPMDELLQLNRKALYRKDKEREALLKRTEAAPLGKLLAVHQPLVRKDGSQVRTEGYIRKVTESPDRERTTVEGLYHDVTGRLAIQSFVDAPDDRVVPDSELFQKLREHEQRQHDYLSSLGHQLITPLGSLVGNLDDLRSGLLIERTEIDDSLQWVIGQAKQCMRMVRNLSYLDKILRQEPFVKKHISMAKICVETKLDFLHLLEEKHIRLKVDDRSLDTHLRVEGHGDLLRQVVVNLVDNAIKYSRPHSTIHLHATTWPRGRVLEISNEGLPIPSEAQKRIFERGFRTPQAKALVPHGTGLGLWLVRKILEAHDASITCDVVDGDRGKRNVFRLIFPHDRRQHPRRLR